MIPLSISISIFLKDFLSISIFFRIALSISISIFSRIALSISISIFSKKDHIDIDISNRAMSTSKIIIFSTRFLEFQKLYEQALTDRYQIALFFRVSPPPPVLLVCLGRFYFQSTSCSEKALFANGSAFHPLPSLFPNWLSLSIYEIVVFLKGVLFLDLFYLHFSFNSHVQYLLSVVQK